MGTLGKLAAEPFNSRFHIQLFETSPLRRQKSAPAQIGNNLICRSTTLARRGASRGIAVKMSLCRNAARSPHCAMRLHASRSHPSTPSSARAATSGTSAEPGRARTAAQMGSATAQQIRLVHPYGHRASIRRVVAASRTPPPAGSSGKRAGALFAFACFRSCHHSPSSRSSAFHMRRAKARTIA